MPNTADLLLLLLLFFFNQMTNYRGNIIIHVITESTAQERAEKPPPCNRKQTGPLVPDEYTLKLFVQLSAATDTRSEQKSVVRQRTAIQL